MNIQIGILRIPRSVVLATNEWPILAGVYPLWLDAFEVHARVKFSKGQTWLKWSAQEVAAFVLQKWATNIGHPFWDFEIDRAVVDARWESGQEGPIEYHIAVLVLQG